MPNSSMQYIPLAWPFLLVLFALVAFLVLLIELDILKYAYARMGVPPRYILAILLLTLLGSSINIPLVQFPQERVASSRVVHRDGMSYVVPVVRERPGTILAINLGGALIPLILSIYLTFKNRLLVRGAIATALIAIVTHQLARPVRGVGITLPLFMPPIIAAVVALVLSWRKAAPLAYIAGSLGTLIGADLLNLDKIPGLGAPIASIGGAGTFDSVFLVGIVAVLLASLFQPRSAANMQPQYRV